MPTVIFDADSTLLTCESLEEVLRAKNIDPQRMQQIQAITAQGMSGEISFISSVQKRLGMATITHQDVIDFGKRVVEYVTPGLESLIHELQHRGIDIWIVSGAARDILKPLGKHLGIPESHLFGIDLQWSSTGEYSGIDETKPINRSKWEGVREIASTWSLPRIAVGDGMTDYALLEHGLVDHFIAFTQNVRRQALINKGVVEAKSVEALRKSIEKLI